MTKGSKGPCATVTPPGSGRFLAKTQIKALQTRALQMGNQLVYHLQT